jgi:Pyridine nucleotide-disulphide oxidoreductase, dimerisation domain
VLGEYSAETVQVVATAMSAGMTVEQLADMQFVFPTFTEAASVAAQRSDDDRRCGAVLSGPRWALRCCSALSEDAAGPQVA